MFFFFNDTATTEIYTLSLHDALPISINAKLREILDEATHKWGAKVSRVELKDINPPRDIRDAMEKQMRAERDRRAAILTAEAEKQSRTLQSEGIRQSEIKIGRASCRERV